VHARSSDIPRATSETFLLGWQPWYAEILLPWVEPDGSPYYRMALELAARLGMDPDKPLASQLTPRRSRAAGELRALSRQRDELHERIDGLRVPLAEEVLRRWPRSNYSYTQNFQRFLVEELDAAQSFILAHPDYRKLAHAQDQYWDIDARLLDAERSVAGFDRVAHLLELARRHRLLEARGDAQARKRYAWLLHCESERL
jgi:hypothetical protein